MAVKKSGDVLELVRPAKFRIILAVDDRVDDFYRLSVREATRVDIGNDICLAGAIQCDGLPDQLLVEERAIAANTNERIEVINRQCRQESVGDIGQLAAKTRDGIGTTKFGNRIVFALLAR